MSTAVKPIPDGSPRRRRIPNGSNSSAFLDGVIDRMTQLRRERGMGRFAFAAPHPGAGTTHVVNLVAEQLVARYRSTVAVVPTSALRENHPSNIPLDFFESAPGVFLATSAAQLQGVPGPGLGRVRTRPSAEDFDYTVIDCRALLTGAHALRWTNSADGVFLVVAAGMTHVNQIEETQRLLKASASRLEGIILNRRNYPIPKFLYKLL